MSDPLLVIPADWVEVDGAEDWLNSVGADHLRSLIESQDWEALSQYFEDAGFIEPNTVVASSTILDLPTGVRMWYVK